MEVGTSDLLIELRAIRAALQRTDQKSARGTQRSVDPGFLPALMDFTFTHYITRRFTEVIYGITVVLSALAAVVLIVAFMLRGSLWVFFLVPLVAAGWVLVVASVRVAMEAAVALTEIAENTRGSR